MSNRSVIELRRRLARL